jgi:preprotein translocase subunit SecF
MELFKHREQSIEFLRHRRWAYVFSGILLLVSFVSFFTQGFKLGIDFTGGVLVEVSYQQPAELDKVRAALGGAGFGEAVVQHFGSAEAVLIRLPPLAEGEKDAAAKLSDNVFKALSDAAPGQVELRRVEFVGPQVGEELTEDGGLAVLYALIGILIYVALRFEYRLAVGAVMAIIHDVVVTLGVFSLFQLDFDLTVLAAILAVIGYSVNDTVVVFDRIREHFRKMRKGTPEQVLDSAITQTLSRTIMTSGTTQLTVFALLFLGGEVVFGFALALSIGIIFGTYSSVYIASAVSLDLGLNKSDLMPVQKEGAEADGLP